MSKFSRREVVVSAGAAAAVFGLDRPLAFVDSALAQESSAAKGFHRFKLADAEVTTVYDGIWERPHDPGFIKNASVEETKAALRATTRPARPRWSSSPPWTRSTRAWFRSAARSRQPRYFPASCSRATSAIPARKP